MKSFLLKLLSVVLLFFAVSCSDGGNDNVNEPDSPDEPLTEEEVIEQIVKNIEDTRDYINPLFIEAGDVFELIKSKEKIEALPNVSQVWNDSVTLFVKTVDGIICSWMYTPEMIDVEWNGRGITARSVDYDEEGYNEHEYKKKKSLVIVNQVSNDGRYSNVLGTINTLSREFDAAGFNVSYVSSGSATLNFFKSIAQYDMCFLVTHGTYDSVNKLHYILTGEEYGEYNRWMDDYYRYFEDNSVTLNTVVENSNGMSATKTYLAFNENFVNKHILSYSNNTILYNTACKSMAGNISLAEAFISKGIDTYCGYDMSNHIGAATGGLFFQHLLEGMNIKDAHTAMKKDIQEMLPAYVSEVSHARVASNASKMCIVHPEVETLSMDKEDITGTSVVVRGEISGWHKKLEGCYGFVIGENEDVTIDDCLEQEEDEVVCTSNDAPIEISAEFADLPLNKKLYVRAYIIHNEYIYYGNAVSFELESTDEITPGQEVDLGLSVKWAGWNVGASSPEEYGGYYAWGEIEEKSDYSLDTYEHYYDADGDGKKDWVIIGKPYEDVCYIGGTECDVARRKWGGKWRMPTYYELEELSTKCVWTKFTYNGVEGRKVTGPNGNSIFLPAAGYREGTLLISEGYAGSYWGDEVVCESAHAAELLFNLTIDARYVQSNSRWKGNTVRPVKYRE